MSPSSTCWADWNVSKTPVHVGAHSGLMYIWETMVVLLCAQANPSHATLLRQQQRFLSHTQTVWSRATCCPGFPPFLSEGSKVLQTGAGTFGWVCLSFLSENPELQWVAPEWQGWNICVIWELQGAWSSCSPLLIHQTHNKMLSNKSQHQLL